MEVTNSTTCLGVYNKYKQSGILLQKQIDFVLMKLRPLVIWDRKQTIRWVKELELPVDPIDW